MHAYVLSTRILLHDMDGTHLSYTHIIAAHHHIQHRIWVFDWCTDDHFGYSLVKVWLQDCSGEMLGALHTCCDTKGLSNPTACVADMYQTYMYTRHTGAGRLAM